MKKKFSRYQCANAYTIAITKWSTYESFEFRLARNPRLLTNRTIVEFGKNRYILLLAGQRLTTLVSGGSHSVDSPRTPYLWS